MTSGQNINRNSQPEQPNIKMSYNEFLANNPVIGYLKVQASRAKQAIPVSNVKIQVYQIFSDLRVLFFSGQTDVDGITPDIELPAPPKSESLSSQDPERGAIYKVIASHPDFEPQQYEIEIFEGITAILPVSLKLSEEE